MRELFISIYTILNVLLIIWCFYDLDDVILYDIDKPYKLEFDFKRYHIVLLIIFPLSVIVLFFIVVFGFICSYLGALIAEILKIICDWLNKPIKKEK